MTRFSQSFLAELSKGAVLAPMAGVTDLPFRRLCLDMGAVYAVTEMVSAKGYQMTGESLRAARELLATDESEQGRIAVQLFGHDPDVVGQAASDLSRTGRYFMVDLNMGCPVPKVTGNGEGSALMRDPEAAYQVMRAAVEGSCVPVSVKMRLGFDGDTFPEIARMAEKADISLLTLHARTRSQYYAGQADWEKIRQLKEQTDLPVIGNGDIRDWTDALRMFELTGCDGIAVGRAADGNPFVFREIRDALAGRPVRSPEPGERRAILLQHARELCVFKGEDIGVREMRRHIMGYVHGMRGAAAFRREVNTLTELPALLEAVCGFFDRAEREPDNPGESRC